MEAISAVLNGFESVLMLVGGSVKFDSSIHQGSGYSLERIYKKATRRLGLAEPFPLTSSPADKINYNFAMESENPALPQEGEGKGTRDRLAASEQKH